MANDIYDMTSYLLAVCLEITTGESSHRLLLTSGGKELTNLSEKHVQGM